MLFAYVSFAPVARVWRMEGPGGFGFCCMSADPLDIALEFDPQDLYVSICMCASHANASRALTWNTDL